MFWPPPSFIFFLSHLTTFCNCGIYLSLSNVSSTRRILCFATLSSLVPRTMPAHSTCCLSHQAEAQQPSWSPRLRCLYVYARVAQLCVRVRWGMVLNNNTAWCHLRVIPETSRWNFFTQQCYKISFARLAFLFSEISFLSSLKPPRLPGPLPMTAMITIYSGEKTDTGIQKLPQLPTTISTNLAEELGLHPEVLGSRGLKI